MKKKKKNLLFSQRNVPLILDEFLNAVDEFSACLVIVVILESGVHLLLDHCGDVGEAIAKVAVLRLIVGVLSSA